MHIMFIAELDRHRRQSERELESLNKKVRELSGRLKSSAHQERGGVSVGATSSSYGGLHVSLSEEGYQEVTMTTSEGIFSWPINFMIKIHTLQTWPPMVLAGRRSHHLQGRV